MKILMPDKPDHKKMTLEQKINAMCNIIRHGSNLRKGGLCMMDVCGICAYDSEENFKEYKAQQEKS